MSQWDDFYLMGLDVGLSEDEAKQAADEALALRHEEEINQFRQIAHENTY